MEDPIKAYPEKFLDERAQHIDISSIDIFSLARHGKLNQLKQVLEYGIDPNSKDKFGNTLLIVGAQNGNKAMCKLALRFGAQINMTNCLGNSALHFCKEYGYEALFQYLVSKGANQKITNLRGRNAKDGLDKRKFCPDSVHGEIPTHLYKKNK